MANRNPLHRHTSVHGLPPGQVPLERALSKLGLCSRTQARVLIEQGRVSVDGVVATSAQQGVVPERVALAIDAQSATQRPVVVLAMNKPRGVLVTRDDPQGRKTIYDVLQDLPQQVAAVGRLDQATSGLLLLTNDTRLADRLLDPRSAVLRRYLVEVQGRVTPEVAAQLVGGIVADGQPLAAHHCEIRKSSGRESQLLLDLTEGKNREVRRLCAAVGHPVLRLVRLAYGPIQLGTLQPGQWRQEDREALLLWLRQQTAARKPDPA